MSMRVISKILDMIIKKYGLSLTPVEILPPTAKVKKIMAKVTGSSYSLSVGMTSDMKAFVRDQATIHGSMSAYIRFLVQMDMRGLIKPQPQQVIYQLPDGQVQMQPANKNPNININKTNNPPILGMSYGEDHLEMMSELDEVLKERKKKIEESTSKTIER